MIKPAKGFMIFAKYLVFWRGEKNLEVTDKEWYKFPSSRFEEFESILG